MNKCKSTEDFIMSSLCDQWSRILSIIPLQIMTVNISLECKPDSCQFADRILSLEPCETQNIGRADSSNRTDCDNGYFNCKVGSIIY